MNEEPLVAQLVTPQPSSKAKAGCAILGCLSVCLLLVALVIGGASYGIYQVVKVANEASARQRAAEESLQAELAGQASAAPGRSAEIVAAFRPTIRASPPRNWRRCKPSSTKPTSSASNR